MSVEIAPLPKSLRYVLYFLLGCGLVSLAVLMSHLPAFGGQFAGL